jgi:hypothetical protein
MPILLLVALVFGALVVWAVVSGLKEGARVAALPADQREAYMRTDQWGRLRPQVICPHCQTRGTVRMKSVRTKTGISGGKATAAVLTGGVSLLATGLSRKESVTVAHCDFCSVTWRL